MSLDDYVPLPTQLATTFGSAATPPPPAPPPLSLPSPSPGSGNGPRSVRELFIAYLPFLSLNEAVSSPFYTFQFLFKLNCYTWNQVILAIREEDLQVGGISEYSVNHAEDIRRSADMVRRGGSWSWQRSDSPMEKEALLRLQEDYESTIKQAADLWEARKKMAEIRRRRVDSRVTALTNAFTFLYVLLSLSPRLYYSPLGS